MGATHAVVLGTSFILRKGSSTFGERRIQGANTIAREVGDILLCSSSFATLPKKKKKKRAYVKAQKGGKAVLLIV